MADRVELEFRRAADALLPEGCRVVAAVSGGGDSVALLELLWRMARGRALDLSVAHLDHGLRRGSGTDRRFVERIARERGLRCRADRRPVRELRRRGESPEEAARRVRRDFLRETLAEFGADWIATGHTLDDQAETVLMRLARGAGSRALAGMAPRGPGPFVRPLLRIERADLRAWLERRGLAFRDDPSNRDLRFDRNRVRRLVVPVLAAALNPRAARHLVAAAERLREDAECLDGMAEREFVRLSRRSRSGTLMLDARGLARLHPSVARRVARLALADSGSDLRRIAARHVDALVGLTGAGGRELHLPNGVRALRRGREIRLFRAG